MHRLNQLSQYSDIVADTADFEQIKNLQPKDTTTNPSLILKASIQAQYKTLIQDAIDYAKEQIQLNLDEKAHLAMAKVLFNFASAISKHISGYVSIELDANFSYDTEKTIQEARFLIDFFSKNGLSQDRILIKIAATWQGIQAAKELEKQGIHTNLTLIFSQTQAIACAEAQIFLISPFVGRVLDWYKSKYQKEYTAVDDPGVLLVKQIYQYYKKFDYKTLVMAASFRNIGEIYELIGCDKITISPELLQNISNDTVSIEKKLDPNKSIELNIEQQSINESLFISELISNEMAKQKLTQGIEQFQKDYNQLNNYLKSQINN